MAWETNAVAWQDKPVRFLCQIVIDTYHTDKNKAVDLVCWDFQKSFDRERRKRLMEKVNAYGIQGDAARWMWNCLLAVAHG